MASLTVNRFHSTLPCDQHVVRDVRVPLRLPSSEEAARCELLELSRALRTFLATQIPLYGSANQLDKCRTHRERTELVASWEARFCEDVVQILRILQRLFRNKRVHLAFQRFNKLKSEDCPSTMGQFCRWLFRYYTQENISYVLSPEVVPTHQLVSQGSEIPHVYEYSELDLGMTLWSATNVLKWFMHHFTQEGGLVTVYSDVIPVPNVRLEGGVFTKEVSRLPIKEFVKGASAARVFGPAGQYRSVNNPFY